MTEEHVFGLSNTSTFSLIPELIETGFGYSYSSSNSLSQTIPNQTGELAEFVGISVYNICKVQKLVEVSEGYCKIVANGNYDVYRETGYDFRP